MKEMRRIDAIRNIAEAVGDEMIVANIGFPSRELFSLHDRNRNFYMVGSMGLASSIGLGLALTTERKIWVIDGDGSVLMNLGTLATIANQSPDNLTLIILDDSSYGSTGCQPTHTSGKTDLAEIARGAGIENVDSIHSSDLGYTLKSRRDKKGPHVIVAKFHPGNAPVPTIPLSPENIKNRFIEAISI